MLATSGRSCRHGRAAGNKGTTLSGALRKAGTILNTPVVRIQPIIRWAQHSSSRLHPPTPPLASRFAVFQCFSVSVFQCFGSSEGRRGRKAKFCRPGLPPPQPPFGNGGRVPFRPLANPRIPRRATSSRFGTRAYPDPRNVPPPAVIVSGSVQAHFVSDHLNYGSAPAPNNFFGYSLQVRSNNVRLWQAFNG